MANEAAKRSIFQCFQNHLITDTLKNTLSGSICHCRFVADGTEEENPLTQTGHQIFLSDDPFVSAHPQSQRSMHSKIRQGSSAARSHCHSFNIMPAMATETRRWHALIFLPLLPCPTSPPLFACRTGQSVGQYQHLIRRYLPRIEIAKVEIVYEWRTCARACDAGHDA